MGKLQINGAALEYAEIGNGQPLVLVHGSASDYRTWRLQQEAFADRFRVIWFSIPRAERVQITGASHMMHEDDAPAYRRALRLFLERHSDAA